MMPNVERSTRNEDMMPRGGTVGLSLQSIFAPRDKCDLW
jgi:hypothetical protein